MTGLRIEPVASSVADVRLRDFVWTGGEPDAAVHERANGDTVLVRSQVTRLAGGLQRQVDRYSVGDTISALDRTVFVIGDDTFAETALYHPGTGNLHARPIELPAVMVVGRPHAPLPGVDAKVTVDFAGLARLSLAEHTIELQAMRIVAEQMGQRRLQWSIAGIGEAWIGENEDRPDQWLCAWSGADRVVFGGVPNELRSADLPSLRIGASNSRESLF